MANQAAPSATPTGLIGGVYRVDFDRVLGDVASPITAYAAHGERSEDAGLMAVSVARGWPARAHALSALTGVAIPNLITPLAHGPGRLPSGEGAYFVVSRVPQGISLATGLRPWSEQEIVQNLLRPVAQILGELHARRLTHRAIRPDNLFQVDQRSAVTLGQAWAAPPASHQPTWVEPPYSAVCLACGRGDGSIADDVYALGAVMVMLALGADPFNDLDPDAVLRRKLDVGSYAAFTSGHRLPAGITEIVRGMLADDPEHRPSPALLNDPQAARVRRIAARPPRRSFRPLDLGPIPASTPRMLAYGLKLQPAKGLALLKSSVIEQWIRRVIGDPATAIQIDEVVKLRDHEVSNGEGRADALLVTRAIAVLDPAAPMTWRSVSIFPDGLGPALDHALHHAPDQVEPLVEIAARQVTRIWADRHPDRDGANPSFEAKDIASWQQATQGEGGTLRLNHMLNPLTPCGSPLFAGRWITRLAEVLPAIDAVAQEGPRGNRLLVDSHLSAFISARRDERMDVDLGQLAGVLTPAEPMSQIRLLARMQQKLHRGELPALCRWAAEAARPTLDLFNSRSRRERLAKSLTEVAARGHLSAIVALVDDKGEQSSDSAGLVKSRTRLAAIDSALNALQVVRRRRPLEARQTGHDVAGALGLLACVGALGLAVFG